MVFDLYKLLIIGFHFLLLVCLKISREFLLDMESIVICILPCLSDFVEALGYIEHR